MLHVLRAGPAFLVLATAALLAGCSSSPSANATQGPTCQDLLVLGQCVMAEGQVLELHDCVQARLVIGLQSTVYDLPDGYTDSPSATSPQRLSFVPMRCRSLAWGNESEADVSLTQLGVIVDAGDRAQDVEADVYGLEVVTDSPLLQSLLPPLGFKVVNGTARIQDAPATREVQVDGDVDYRATIALVPQSDSTPIPGTLAQHAESYWLRDARTCTQFFSSGHGQVTASKGTLAQAMPDQGPLLGSASQAVLCDGSLDVHRF